MTTHRHPRARRGRPPGRRPARRPASRDPSNYFNRELSWLDFNLRVLELAEDAALPLLERTKFASIYTSNLDEFFMVRVAGLHDQIEAGVERPGIDGRTPSQTLEALHERVLEHGARLARCVSELLLPALARARHRRQARDRRDARASATRSPSTSAA